jgi:hypothetical protein
MSKSLNFVINIRLDRRSTDVNGNHPIKLRVWNRASKRVKMYSSLISLTNVPRPIPRGWDNGTLKKLNVSVQH